tara:strand:- start:7245 stop:7928 length:684 start_codon:yes stop_codon:yes gene_type:complete
MIVSIHQPQYMPWLPYFSKIASADTFVFLDKVQYQKNGLHNRNELKNSNGRFWLTIPVSANLGDKLNEVKISDERWSKKHIKSIKINYGKSINYEFFTNHIQNILEQKIENLVDVNIKIIEIICRKYFNIDTQIIRQSEIDVRGEKSELILNICKKLNAKVYLSGIGGKSYLKKSEFNKNKIDINYLENNPPQKYSQLHPKLGFINNISALDFILNVGSDWSKYYTL